MSIQRFSKPSHENSIIKSFPSVQEDNVNYLHIGNDGLKLESQPRKEALDFWNKLKQLYATEHMKKSDQERDEL